LTTEADERLEFSVAKVFIGRIRNYFRQVP